RRRRHRQRVRRVKASDPLGLAADRLAKLETMIAEERRSAKLPRGEPVAALFGFGRAIKEFAARPDPPAGSDEPIALIPFSRRRAYEIAVGVDYAMSVRIALKYLWAAAAQAILRGRDRSIPELTARRRAMADLEAELLHVDLSAPRR